MKFHENKYQISQNFYNKTKVQHYISSGSLNSNWLFSFTKRLCTTKIQIILIDKHLKVVIFIFKNNMTL